MAHRLDYPPQLNELSNARTAINDKLAACATSKATLTITREGAQQVVTALASIRARFAAGLTAKERQDIRRILIAAVAARTIGKGRDKSAEVTIELKWGETQNLSPATCKRLVM